MKKQIYFTSDSQLLAELGERLIASPQTALGELIKNAYDADATQVNIWLSDKGKTLNIKDDGNGMTEAEFTSAWMTIASSHKADEEKSRVYKRSLTGSKGVGRFAVRFLGDHLALETSDGDEALKATFPWEDFEAGEGIEETPITYETEQKKIEKGTWLKISGLRHAWTHDMLDEVSAEVLQLQTPKYVALAIAKKAKSSGDFNVSFSPPGEDAEREDPTEEIFKRAAITLHIEVKNKDVEFVYTFQSGRPSRRYDYRLKDNLIGSLEADVRFLPKRKGQFAGLEHHNGKDAAAWVRKNGGVKVFDRGFRVPPYGGPEDDWLKLSESVAARRRSWDSFITQALLPLPAKAPVASLHPALHLPANHQVLGYVALETPNLAKAKAEQQQRLLQPAMDRQGFVDNEGFEQLYNIVRGGMELLAQLDLEEELRRKKKKREEEASELRKSLLNAVDEVQNNPTIPAKVRKTIASQLRALAVRAKKAEASQADVEVAVESLGLLGIVAAFMTHEMTTMQREIKAMLTALDRVDLDVLKSADKGNVEKALTATKAAQEALTRHIDYVQKFAANVRSPGPGRFNARPAIKEVVRQFDYFTKPRKIDVDVDVPNNLQAPKMPMSIYSGIVLNLYTNALKAVLSKKDGDARKIRIEATEDDDGAHVVQVLDTGIGVAESLKDRIFEPLFSTTADDGPLGPGMGMGLYIVRRVVKSFDGKIRLVTPPDGYATAMELRMPNG